MNLLSTAKAAAVLSVFCVGSAFAAPTSGQIPPTAPKAAAKTQGELGDVNIVGQSKEKLTIGKFDPPAAFNLEDIQNFPEDRLQPVLNNPLVFEEGRDFSTMMDFQEEQLVHPWLPEVAKAPFLTMKTGVEKASADWAFSVIDQGGTTVAKQDGKGTPPALIPWNGEDSLRDHLAVETVYIPQLATTDKEGYRHTYMGQPVQFSALMYSDKSKTVIELSSKRLFQEKKSDLTKEAPLLLDKVCDVIRESAHVPFAIQPYESDSELGRSRQQTLVKYFSEKLYIPENQMVAADVQTADKRGAAIAIIASSMPGGSGQ
jgi:hypothetical protein